MVGFVKGNMWGNDWRMNTWPWWDVIVEIPQPYEVLEGGNPSVAKPTTKSIKGKIYFFMCFSFTNLLLSLISCHVACLLLLRSNPSRHHSKILHRWGVRRRGKIGKHGKVGVKRVVGFSSASLFPTSKQEAVIQGGTMGPGGQTTWWGEQPRELELSKAGRTSETVVAFQIHSHKTRIS